MKNINKYLLTLSFWLLALGFNNAQVNLVLNPSFEQLKSCPNNWFQADSLKDWGWLNQANSSNLCKVDLYSICCTNPPYCSVPNNDLQYQYPRTGNSYIEFITLNSIPPTINNNSRPYLKGQLNQTLQAGKIYCLTFYYNAANYIIYATNRFGAYVDNGTVANYNCCKDMPVTPQVQNNPSTFMTDTMNWVKIQGSFIAIGNENTITLGNFVDSATVQFQLFNSNGSRGPYYAIDDVSLIPIDLPASAGKDTSITKGDSAYIGRASEIGLDDDCTWYVLGNATAIDTMAGLWVKPTATTSYVVEQNICGTISYDTVVVSVSPTGIKELAGNNGQVNVYPNPAQQFLTITTLTEQGEIKITDVLGNEVIHEPIQKALQVDVSSLNKGVYFITFVSGNTSYTGKFIKD